MEIPKAKIAFYRKRTFGEKLNACFDFIKENWKPLWKYTTYMILPLCLLQALSLNSLMSTAFNMGAMAGMGTTIDDFSVSFIAHYALAIIWAMISGLLLYSMIYSLMQLYNVRENGLQGITFADIKPYLFRNMKKFLLIFLFMFGVMFVVMFVVVLIGVVLWPTLFLTIPALIAVMIPLALFLPIYMFEEISLMDAFKKSYKLGFATYGGVLAVSIVSGLIVSVIQGAATTPWYIGMIIKSLFTLSEGGIAGGDSFIYTFGMYILAVIMTYGTYLAMIISLIAIAYQYSHANEVVNGVTIQSDIENFDQLV